MVMVAAAVSVIEVMAVAPAVNRSCSGGDGGDNSSNRGGGGAPPARWETGNIAEVMWDEDSFWPWRWTGGGVGGGRRWRRRRRRRPP
mmetsp:Transcript_55035/g.134974  ORF Transcript_55035/g.134974 Transcript_55035/m.134974 type:complete len:87 (+) Transcript_55035:224-484(+)